jgi:hypothetical protein
MILGMSISTFTTLHVVISLVGIGTGFVVFYGMLVSKRLESWTAVFLTATVLTSVTGFMFPFVAIGPPHIFGAISLPVLALIIYAFYVGRPSNRWRWIYVLGAILVQYLNVVVAIVQTFLKIEIFNAIAPNQTEPPFAFAQGIVLVAFAAFAFFAVRNFQSGPAGRAG